MNSFAAAQFRILQRNFKKIFDSSVQRNFNQSTTKFSYEDNNRKMLKLKKLIKKHQELIAYVKKIDDLINVIIFFVVATCVVQIVFLWFQITLVKYSSPHFLKSLFSTMKIILRNFNNLNKIV